MRTYDRRQWAAYLSTLLIGKALEVYFRLDQKDAEEYSKVKTALLKRYEMTEEGFHQIFRSDVLKVCHESLMGGHMGVRKTLDIIVSQFYWP